MKYWLISIGIALAIIAILITYIAYNNMPDLIAENKQLRADNRHLQQEINDLSFQYTALKLNYYDMELDLYGARLEVVQLKARDRGYDKLVELIEIISLKSLDYINTLQIRLMEVNDDYGYPKFIYRDILMEIITEGIKEE
jgi:hypothetical protein